MSKKKLEIADVERMSGKTIKELMKNPESRAYLAEVISDSALKQLLDIPPNRGSSESEIETMKRWLIEYGRRPTTKEIIAKAKENLKYFKERNQKIVSHLVSLIRLEDAVKGQADEAEERKYTESIRAEYREALGFELFQRLEQQAQQVVSKEKQQEWLKETRENYGNIRKNEDRINRVRKKMNIAPSEKKDIEKDGLKENESYRSKIEKAYAKFNPELAALREKERNGSITTKERREAVKAYYKKQAIKGR